MDSFPEVTPTTGKGFCAKCKLVLKAGDVIHAVKIVAGVGKHPQGWGECVYVSDFEELVHADCADTFLKAPHIEIIRGTLRADKDMQQLRARTPDYMCARCHKRLVREDRIALVLIVEGIGIDPETQARGIQCSPEFESVHIDCRDRTLTGGT